MHQQSGMADLLNGMLIRTAGVGNTLQWAMENVSHPFITHIYTGGGWGSNTDRVAPSVQIVCYS